MTCRLALLVLLASACAHVEPPPGGPEDKEPPRLLVSRPDTLAVVPGWNSPVVLVFDERLSEQGLERAVTVSPRTSAVAVDHRGDELRVSLRRGWESGTIYQVTVLPQVRDLFGNQLGGPVQLTFSTGPTIPRTRVTGTAYDPITGAPEREVRVEAIRQVDSLVYDAPVDSAGRFVMAHIPAGEYLFRAYRDLNSNRMLDGYEPRGTAIATVAEGDSVSPRLGVLVPDSTPPVVLGAAVRDGLLELRFDDFLEPGQRIAPARIQITSADGRFVPVRNAGVGRTMDPGSAADTATVAPLPARTVIAEVTDVGTLPDSAEYRVRTSDIRNLHGLAADTDTTLVIRVQGERAPPPDSVPGDSVPADPPAVGDTAPVAVRPGPALAGRRFTDPLDLFRPRTPHPR